MAETKSENSSSNQSSVVADSLTRRELLRKGGQIAVAAAVSSVFSPFFIHSARAATKTLSFWQFYAPKGISGLQSKWFVDCVAAWNATHDVKVELQYVPNNDYMNGSKLQTAFASGRSRRQNRGPSKSTVSWPVIREHHCSDESLSRLDGILKIKPSDATS